jgi:hypothetical protein
MTTCDPKRALRCWQFAKERKDAQPIPLWAAGRISTQVVEGRLELTFHFPDTGADLKLDGGDWIVELDPGAADDYIAVYTEAEFFQEFDLTPEPG